MLMLFGTESFPARPVPVKTTPTVGRVASVLLMIASASLIGTSGENLTDSACDFPGAILNVFGLTVKTEPRDGGSIRTATFPSRAPLPVFLILKLLETDCPIAIDPRLSDPGAPILAPVGIGVAVGVAVGVRVGVTVGVAVFVGVAVAVAVAVVVEVEVGVAVRVKVAVVVGVVLGVGVAVGV